MYALPYGGISFASHLITYYTMTMLYLGRKPLLPWKRVEHKKWSLGLSLVSLITTTVLACISIAQLMQSLSAAATATEHQQSHKAT